MMRLSVEQETRAMGLHRIALVINALDTDYSILEKKYFQRLRDGGANVPG